MSFPWHQRSWHETAEFLGARVRPGARVLAPDEFFWIVARVDRWVPENLCGAPDFDWVVLRVADLPQIPRRFVEDVADGMTPVHANDTFVVWTSDPTWPPEPDLDDRLDVFRARLADLPDEPTEPNRYVLDAAIGDAPRIVRHTDLSDRELRAAMDDLHARSGYLYPTYRDQVYRADMEQHVHRFLERCRESSASGPTVVLDLGSGSLPYGALPDGIMVVRSELSEVGTRIARRVDDGRRELAHVMMDAQRLGVADGSCAGVTFIDSIEHVRDSQAVFEEVVRVLAPSGLFLVTFANRRSVNMLLTQKLGYPEFVTNHQHFREFTLADVRDLLGRAGLDLVETAGHILYPYWAVPGVDEIVRDVVDNDHEFVDLMRDLGSIVGAEHAYTGIVLARRAA